MFKILCFGDSNTYGFNPENYRRYDENTRWSGILKHSLNKYTIIEKGCNNRAIYNNAGEFNSLNIIEKYLNDIDLVILQVGINDLQIQYNFTQEEFEKNLKNLLSKIKTCSRIKNIILICPNVIKESILNSYFSNLFDKKSIEDSKKLPELYKKISKEYNCNLIDLNTIITPSKIDGLHCEKEAHKQIATEVQKQIECILK